MEDDLGTQVIMLEEAAANHLGVSVRTMQNWRQVGGGPRYVKLGRAVRYRMSDLDDFINSRVRESTRCKASAPLATS
jgi:predicted DNA-binding transcriptional regulator AlpA